MYFNVLTIFGWENFGELMDNRQICQCFTPLMFCAIRYSRDIRRGGHRVRMNLLSNKPHFEIPCKLIEGQEVVIVYSIGSTLYIPKIVQKSLKLGTQIE